MAAGSTSIRRFDREGRKTRIPVEDFAQLSGATRDTKYNSSLERIAKLVKEFCTFPALEKPKLARRLLFCFLTGKLWLDYFCGERLRLSPGQIDAILADFRSARSTWHEFIDRSHLPGPGKEAYHKLLGDRSERLGI